MPYKLNMSANVDFPKLEPMPSIPKWVVDKMPKNKHCHLHFQDGDWFLDGKKIKEAKHQGGAK